MRIRSWSISTCEQETAIASTLGVNSREPFRIEPARIRMKWAMRPSATACFLGCLVWVGCGRSPSLRGSGTNLAFVVESHAESKACESPVTPEATCTITMTARVELGELEGRDWNISSVQAVVRDGRSGQDLRAVPGVLTSDEIRRLTGSSVLAAHGRLTIPLELRFVIGQAPFYVDGPHELQVIVIASGSS